jgi:hypothetical protein
MAQFLTWSGWIFGFASLGVAMWQLIEERIRRAARDAHASHLRATIQQLQIVRAMFTEALQKGEVFKVEADRAVIRAVAHDLLAAENHIRAAIGQDEPVPALPSARRAQGE